MSVSRNVQQALVSSWWLGGLTRWAIQPSNNHHKASMIEGSPILPPPFREGGWVGGSLSVVGLKSRWTALLDTLFWLSLLGTLVASCVVETEWIGAGVVLSGLILFMQHGLGVRQGVPWTRVDTLVLGFFSTALVATTFSSYVHSSIIGLGKFLIFALAFWVYRQAFANRPNSLFWVWGVLALLGLFESLVGFYQYINHVQPLATWQDTSVNPEDQLTRIFGTLKPSNPNLLAGFLIPCLAATVGLAGRFGLSDRLRGVTWLFWMAALLELAALVLTGSRGGFLAIGVMGIIAYVGWGILIFQSEVLGRYKTVWKLIGLSVLGAIALAFFSLPAIRNRFLSIFAMREDSSNSYRINVWASTWRMILDNWLLGIGPGNTTFKQVYGLYMVPGYNALSAYSIFLEMWAEQGILGLLAFLGILTVAKLRVYWVIFSTAALQVRWTVIVLWMGLSGSVLYGLFDTIWYRPSVNLLFWLFLAGLTVWTEQSIRAEQDVPA